MSFNAALAAQLRCTEHLFRFYEEKAEGGAFIIGSDPKFHAVIPDQWAAPVSDYDDYEKIASKATKHETIDYDGPSDEWTPEDRKVDGFLSMAMGVMEAAPTYFVSRDLCELTQVAAETIPPEALCIPGDIPTESGFVYFEHFNTPQVIDEDGRIAEVASSGPSAVFWWRQDAEVLCVQIDQTSTNTYGLFHIPFREQLLGHNEDIYGWHQAQMFAFWRLIQQTLVATMQRPAKRQLRRKVQRRHPELGVITVQTLRQTLHRPTGEEGPTVDYDHRWLVRGHWRNQWYPKAGVHSPLWIAPHVKGPEDKPLVIKRRGFNVIR